MLLPNERKFIEETFEVKVTDRYGCEEVSLIASECERHEGMHLNIEHLFIEFLDENENPVKPGKAGNIVVTDLMNKAMPFIRYRVEDVGVPTNRKCSCGRGLPIMEHVVGRAAEFLIKDDGTKVAGVSLIENTLTRIAGLEQMQIVQNNLDRFLIRIVPGNAFNREVHNQLISYFKKIFGDKINVEIALVKEILPEKSGKYRFSICLIN